MLSVNIQRFNPEKDTEPHMQHFEIPLDPGVSVLGALDYIRVNLDETLAYKIFCTNQHCGECGVMLNGKPVLACRDLITTPEATIKPLKSFDVVKDLVVDIDTVVRKQWSDLPLLEGHMVYSDLLTEDQHTDFFMVGGCIGCAICQSVCPIHKQGEELLSGPAYYAAVAQYLMRAKTLDELKGYLSNTVEHRILDCSACKQCSKNCPKDVQPFKVVADIITLIDKHLDSDISERLLKAAQAACEGA